VRDIPVATPAAQAANTDAGFDWRQHLAVHPAADELPVLSDAELRALADDIKAYGLRTDIVLWSSSDPTDKYEALLDGRHRLDALALLGLLCLDEQDRLATSKVWNGDAWVDDGTRRALRLRRIEGGDPYALALSYNVHRRHLTAEQKRAIIAALLKTKPDASNLAIAKQVKADDKTVAKVRTDLERRSEIPNVKTRVDTKGRKQPAKKSKAAKPKSGTAKAVATKDTVLIAFTQRVLDLVQRIGKHRADRFIDTAVKTGDLVKLGDFFNALARLKGTEVST
jgi:hypothetical protein